MLKKLNEKTKSWLLGGGCVVLITFGITVGVNRSNLSNRLDNNDIAHSYIETKLDTTSKKVSTIDERTIRIEEHLKHISNNTYDENGGTGLVHK